jgi:hypothetical protein
MPPRWTPGPGFRPFSSIGRRHGRIGRCGWRLRPRVLAIPVRVRMSGVEVEGVIIDASTTVLRVKVTPAAVKADTTKSKRTRTA